MSSEPIATSFIGSFHDEPDEALIVLRGDIDTATVQRLGVHIADVLAAGARHLRIDAAAVDSYEEPLLELLGRTQHRIGRRRGLLQVQGLHPSKLRSAATAAPPPGPPPATPEAAPPSRRHARRPGRRRGAVEPPTTTH